MDIFYTILMIASIFILAIGLSVIIIYLKNKNNGSENISETSEKIASSFPSDGNDYESLDITLEKVKQEFAISYNPSNQIFGKDKKESKK